MNVMWASPNIRQVHPVTNPAPTHGRPPTTHLTPGDRATVPGAQHGCFQESLPASSWTSTDAREHQLCAHARSRPRWSTSIIGGLMTTDLPPPEGDPWGEMAACYSASSHLQGGRRLTPWAACTAKMSTNHLQRDPPGLHHQRDLYIKPGGVGSGNVKLVERPVSWAHQSQAAGGEERDAVKAEASPANVTADELLVDNLNETPSPSRPTHHRDGPHHRAHQRIHRGTTPPDAMGLTVHLP